MTAIETLKMNGLYTDVIGIVNDYTNGDKKYWRGKMDGVFSGIWMYRPLRHNQIYRYVNKQVTKALLDIVDDPNDILNLSDVDDDKLREFCNLINNYTINPYARVTHREYKYTQEKIDKMNRLYPEIPKCDMIQLRRNLWEPHMGDINDNELLIEYIDYIVDEEFNWVFAELEDR